MTRRLLWQRVLDVSMFAATIAAVGVTWVDHFPDWTIMAILVTFVAMFFGRWWIDDNRRQWMRSNWFDLVLVVLLSSPILRMLMALRLVHLLPALRIGVLLRANRKRLLHLLVISGDSLPASLALLFALVFCFGTATFLFETGSNPQFAHFQDGLWWAFVTLTTVGYGDIVPITHGGRIAAVFAMIFGIVVYSLIVANLTVFLQDYTHRKGNDDADEKKAAPDESPEAATQQEKS